MGVSFSTLSHFLFFFFFFFFSLSFKSSQHPTQGSNAQPWGQESAGHPGSSHFLNLGCLLASPSAGPKGQQSGLEVTGLWPLWPRAPLPAGWGRDGDRQGPLPRVAGLPAL